jgi:hypothetical protein
LRNLKILLSVCLFLLFTDFGFAKNPTSKKLIQTICKFGKSKKKGVKRPYVFSFMLNLSSPPGLLLKPFIIGNEKVTAEISSGAVFFNGKSTLSVRQISSIVPKTIHLLSEKTGSIELVMKNRMSRAWLVFVVKGESLKNRPSVLALRIRKASYLYALTCDN